ncbi:MAG: tetratricopeptide repeat protein [Armatimonadetes bacterium]|nr:tetratricopeptide repeat protein [Armatimonadota bacterium]
MGRPKPRITQRGLLICVLLIIATVAVYWQTLEFDFTNYDDNVYVYENPFIRQGLNFSSIKWAFTTSRASNWHPLVWISLMLDYRLGELDPAQYHLTNLVLHAANAILLFIVLNKMTGLAWRGAFVAGVFAVHPLHVESVAWVTERKDVLSTLFMLITLLAYLHYVRRPSVGRYAFVALAFAIGLMAKPMLVTLPLLMLLFDYWPLGRFGVKNGRLRELVIEKIPLFVLSAASMVVTLYVQHAFRPERVTVLYPFGVRFANAIYSYCWYIYKTFLPTKLAVFYPHPGNSLPTWIVVTSGVFLLVVTSLVLINARRFPYLAVGWFFYLVSLVPVIGFVQVGEQGMADRYTYVPMIGLLVALTWGAGELMRVRPVRIAAAVSGSCVVLVVLAIIAYEQTGYWRNSITLFSHAIRVTRNNVCAHYNLAQALKTRGDDRSAMKHLLEAHRLRPVDTEINNTLGAELLQMGKIDEAIACFKEALKTRQQLDRTLSHLGVAYVQKGDLKQAERYFRKALRINPQCAIARDNLKIVEMMTAKQ